MKRSVSSVVELLDRHRVTGFQKHVDDFEVSTARRSNNSRFALAVGSVYVGPVIKEQSDRRWRSIHCRYVQWRFLLSVASIYVGPVDDW